MSDSHILIVDDDPSVIASLALLLKQAGYASRCADSPVAALAQLERERPALVLQDMNFSRQTTGEEGLALLQEIKARQPDVPVVLITAWGSIDLAVRGIKAGAADFVTKPWSNPQLLQCVRTSLGLAASRDEAHALTREEVDTQGDFGGLIGRDPGLLQALAVVCRVSATDASVLITGESGTGKDLVAEAIHRNSLRRAGPFVKVNLGGVPAALFDSELFGHVRGAFTDARQDRQGRFGLAEGGTILLDEIGDVDASCQVKLLRVLQDRTYQVLGSSRTCTADVRVVSATNRNLADLVAKGQFREDLLYRLNLIALHLPALRDRAADIPVLSQHFTRHAAQAYHRPGLAMTDGAVRWLQAQPWPGNIRQLKQLLERAALVSANDALEAADLAAAARMQADEGQPARLPAPGTMTLEEIEKAMILRCLEQYDRNVTRAAEALGLSRAALYRRCEKHGIAL